MRISPTEKKIISRQMWKSTWNDWMSWPESKLYSHVHTVVQCTNCLQGCQVWKICANNLLFTALNKNNILGCSERWNFSFHVQLNISLIHWNHLWDIKLNLNFFPAFFTDLCCFIWSFMYQLFCSRHTQRCTVYNRWIL